MADSATTLDNDVQAIFGEAYARVRGQAIGPAQSLPMSVADINAVKIPDPRAIFCPLYTANKDKICQWLQSKLGVIPAKLLCAALDALCRG